MIAAWLAQLLDAEAACKLAVYLHGMAGDLADADEGEVALTSADLAAHLGDAVMELTARRKVVDREGSGVTLTTHSESETADTGRELAASLRPGSVVLLIGDLGAGKTAFVRGLAEGLGVPSDDVSSPTFTLVQEYRGGRLSLFHVDLYRLNDPREIDDLGLDEIADEGVLAIEWAEKMHTDAAGIRPRHHRARQRPRSARHDRMASRSRPRPTSTLTT